MLLLYYLIPDVLHDDLDDLCEVLVPQMVALVEAKALVGDQKLELEVWKKN